MKLLRITAEGLPLFKEKLDLSFYAQQRVTEEQKNILYPLFANIWVNSAIGFIGINASGKTSVLKVILLALEIINMSRSIILRPEIFWETQKKLN